MICTRIDSWLGLRRYGCIRIYISDWGQGNGWAVFRYLSLPTQASQHPIIYLLSICFFYLLWPTLPPGLCNFANTRAPRSRFVHYQPEQPRCHGTPDPSSREQSPVWSPSLISNARSFALTLSPAPALVPVPVPCACIVPFPRTPVPLKLFLSRPYSPHVSLIILSSPSLPRSHCPSRDSSHPFGLTESRRFLSPKESTCSLSHSFGTREQLDNRLSRRSSVRLFISCGSSCSIAIQKGSRLASHPLSFHIYRTVS